MGRPHRAFVAPGVVTGERIASVDKQRRFLRYELALKTIAKLDVFDDPADAANAAIRIATEALK